METDVAAVDKDRGGRAENALIIPESEHPIRETNLDREALKVLYRLRDAGFKGYLVGGGVRDLYLGKKPKDFDISTDARPGQLRKLFRNSRTIGRRFRLVQVFFRGNKIIEVSTLRSQSEYDLNGPDQVLPHNNTFGTLEEDAFRRDLTINALFYEIENNNVIDYVGGVEDLKSGVVRVVGEPERRFTRDPVRMMRAIRHAARTGFEIAPETLAAIEEHADKLLLCPPSRLRDEVFKDLQSGAARPWAELCLKTPLWKTLFPVYNQLLAGPESQEVKDELLRLLEVLDRLHRQNGKQEQEVKIPEFMMIALLLLPWACRKYKLLEGLLRGKAFHKLLGQLRTDLTDAIGERFNIKRMTKESIVTLLVNFPTFHHHAAERQMPKWLKKKSYYRDCISFYGLYRESAGEKQVSADFFQKKTRAEPVAAVEGNTEDKNGGEKSAGRKGCNPAFSSNKHGVFGLRRES